MVDTEYHINDKGLWIKNQGIFNFDKKVKNVKFLLVKLKNPKKLKIFCSHDL